MAIKFTHRPGLVVYLTCGDPTLEISRDVALAAIGAGADVIELGVPFSDPVADGPVIQRASERALKHGTDLAGVLDIARQIRQQSKAGLIIFSYLNPILQFGLEKFCAAAKGAGVDGALVTDLPVEEAHDYLRAMKAHKLAPVFLAAPTSTDERLRAVAKEFAGIRVRHLAHRHHRNTTGSCRRCAIAGATAASLHEIADCGRLWSFDARTVCRGRGVRRRGGHRERHRAAH